MGLPNPIELGKPLYELFVGRLGEQAGHFSFIAVGCALSGLMIFSYASLVRDLYRKQNPKRHSIHQIFTPSYEKYAKTLGDATSEMETSHVYQGVHENATILWIERQNSFFRLPADPSSKWTRVPDPEWQAGSEWYRDADLRRRFRPPKDLGPPYGGVANRWSQDPSSWKWIGWRKWHCYYTPNAVSFQGFDHGAIVGPFRLNPLNNSAQVFILFEDGRWLSEIVAAEVPTCEEPPYQR